MSDAESPQFVDTNVLVYAHDQSAGEKHRRARELLGELWANRTGCLSVQILQEFYVTITQKVARPLKPETASQIIADLGVWRVHQPGVDDILAAIQLQGRHRLAFWDAMMLTSAAALDCEIVWSEDLNPGQQYDQVVVSNPFASAA
ncbi:MAG: PIN domain-containing protein [Chloroflexi bacterium]|nr:PIN domain-containing protein [Chloroflexota bacterium]